VDAGSFCIQQNENGAAATWFNAVVACGNNDARLCEVQEWYHACTQAGTLGINDMLDGDEEWTGSVGGGAAPALNHAALMGSTQTPFSCTQRGADFLTVSYVYRCCQ
jgi:hypothetical protein